jgi:hypothetical protein
MNGFVRRLRQRGRLRLERDGFLRRVVDPLLENGKQLLVGSNDDPFGSNLVFVLEFA